MCILHVQYGMCGLETVALLEQPQKLHVCVKIITEAKKVDKYDCPEGRNRQYSYQ